MITITMKWMIFAMKIHQTNIVMVMILLTIAKVMILVNINTIFFILQIITLYFVDHMIASDPSYCDWIVCLLVACVLCAYCDSRNALSGGLFGTVQGVWSFCVLCQDEQ